MCVNVILHVYCAPNHFSVWCPQRPEEGMSSLELAYRQLQGIIWMMGIEPQSVAEQPELQPSQPAFLYNTRLFAQGWQAQSVLGSHKKVPTLDLPTR